MLENHYNAVRREVREAERKLESAKRSGNPGRKERIQKSQEEYDQKRRALSRYARPGYWGT